MPVAPLTDANRSEEVQDIIGRPPSWVIRMGTVVIASIVLLSLIGAWFIHYPELIEAPITFASATPSVQLAARSSGRLKMLYVHDGDIIRHGQLVGVMENAASTQDMFRLAQLAKNLDTTLSIESTLAHTVLPKSVQAGDIQSDYTNLYQAIGNYNFFLASHYHRVQLANLRTQITYYNRLNAELGTKQNSLNKQLALEKQKDSTNRILMNQKVIAKLDFNNNHKLYLNQQLLSSDNNTSIIQNQLQRSENEKTVTNLQHEYNTQQQEQLSRIRAAAKILVGRIANWDQQYVLRTPISGKITFFKVWTSNQYVKMDDPIFVVVPRLNSQYARASLPIYKAGKVKTGQVAFIKLDEYPFQEFGLLRGTVTKVSEVALDNKYLITIRLISLRTTTGYLLPLRAELSGTAQLVTEDQNIIKRIFNQVYLHAKR